MCLCQVDAVGAAQSFRGEISLGLCAGGGFTRSVEGRAGKPRGKVATPGCVQVRPG